MYCFYVAFWSKRSSNKLSAPFYHSTKSIALLWHHRHFRIEVNLENDSIEQHALKMGINTFCMVLIHATMRVTMDCRR